MSIKLIGTIVHGVKNYLHVCLPEHIDTGGNLTVEILRQVVVDLHSMGKLQRTLCIQMDNCHDNKTLSVFTFADKLVRDGIVDEVRISFLLVGHTHEDIDQLFSVISKHVKRRDVLTSEQLADELVAVSSKWQLPTSISCVANVRDWYGVSKAGTKKEPAYVNRHFSGTDTVRVFRWQRSVDRSRDRDDPLLVCFQYLLSSKQEQWWPADKAVDAAAPLGYRLVTRPGGLRWLDKPIPKNYVPPWCELKARVGDSPVLQRLSHPAETLSSCRESLILWRLSHPMETLSARGDSPIL